MNVISPKKLIEVALPLDAINVASVREGYIYRGNPSAIHKWWAQRPLAAARAVIFAQLVHDPEDLWRCQNPNTVPNQQHRGHWTKTRARLFGIIEDLVKWETITNEDVLDRARAEIRKSWLETCELNRDHPEAKSLFNPESIPCLNDPFAGGGTIPLEAQRLGLSVFASDLNPLAVLINKALIEIPNKFTDKPPVHPEAKNLLQSWEGTSGLAEDVRKYGTWMRNEAANRLSHLYPTVTITAEVSQQRPDLAPYKGKTYPVIAWLWSRTVKSPNPAFSTVDVPLTATYVLSDKANRKVYVEPVKTGNGYRFVVRVGTPSDAARKGTKVGPATFKCLMSDTPIGADYIRHEATHQRIGFRLMALVIETADGRVYIDPNNESEEAAPPVRPEGVLDIEFFQDALGFRIGNYGMSKWRDIYTPRQLIALECLTALVAESIPVISQHAIASGFPRDTTPLASGGTGSQAYAEAVSLYLAFAVNKHAMYGNALVPWFAKEDRPSFLFTQQVISMTWDFVEIHPLATIGGTFTKSIEIVHQSLANLPKHCPTGSASQQSATDVSYPNQCFVSTDPPYYDNIGYADLSDFFYVWARRSLRTVFPDLLATMTVPKLEELVATPVRHGTKREAETFFLEGMITAMRGLAARAHPSAPITIYYAFRQSETKKEAGTSSTGWETFLEAVFRAGMSLTGTWPIRTERSGRQRGNSSNALASSIVLVCRPRAKGVGTIGRRQFVRILNEALPLALDAMTRESEGLHSPVAPVDLSQAIIGPGMAIYSRYDAVLEADGTPMSVKTALQLINRFLAEDDFDGDTQFCLHWFDQYGWETGKFGEADTLARAKGTSVAGVQQAGVIEAGGGNVRLFRWRELDPEWDPATDPRIPVWQVLHQIILSYQTAGDSGAGRIYSHPSTSAKTEAARQLAYRLYTLCERRGWAEDARAYNEVVTGWSGIESAAVKVADPQQLTLFDNEETP